MIKLEWGISEVDVTSSDLDGLLSEISSKNIVISNIHTAKGLTYKLLIKRKDLKEVRRIVHQRFDDLVEIKTYGISTILKKVLTRPVLVVGLLIWIWLLLYIPGKILFVQVDGNTKIPKQLIIEHAEKCGIVFGASRREVRSEKVKTALLSEIPELQWVGVNTYGCLAVISVKERSLTESMNATPYVGHIVSVHDGIINGLTVTKGTPLCTLGQAVVKGQILVSGYTDCGLVLRAEAASAEVTAITERKLTVKTLNKRTVRKQIIDTQTDYSIQIGKNIVELSHKTGFPQGRCAKIYENESFTLPGGIQLPVMLIREKTVLYADEETDKINPEREILLLAGEYMREQMLMGRILSSHHLSEITENGYETKVFYICEEMIGKFRKEEIIEE